MSLSPVQCYGETTYCWCVDQDGREVPGTRSHDVVKPACEYPHVNCIMLGSLLPIVAETLFNPSNLVPGLPSVAPPTVRPLPRPDVTPPTNTEITLLYAQGQKIGALPLNGTRLDASRSTTLLTLHVRADQIKAHVHKSFHALVDSNADRSFVSFFLFSFVFYSSDIYLNVQK